MDAKLSDLERRYDGPIPAWMMPQAKGAEVERARFALRRHEGELADGARAYLARLRSGSLQRYQLETLACTARQIVAARKALAALAPARPIRRAA